MPRAKKAPGIVVRDGKQSIVSDPGKRVTKFLCPPFLTERARQAWDDFWDDRPALLLTPASKLVLVRWIQAVDRYERALKVADEDPLIAGQNTTVANPMYRIAEQALKTIIECEKQLGIGTLNATQLGIAAIAEQQRLGDLNARYEGPQDAEGVTSDDRGAAQPRPARAAAPEQDPRLLQGNDLLS